MSRSRSPQRSNSPPRESEIRYKPNDTGRGPKQVPYVEPCNVLAIFGLNNRSNEDDIVECFKRYGDVKKCTLIRDKSTGFSKCIAFIEFETVEEATKVRDSTQDLILAERSLRVDFSKTQKPHDATPGKYLGKGNLRDDRRSYRRSRSYDRRDHRSGRDYRDYDRRDDRRDSRDTRDYRDRDDRRDYRRDRSRSRDRSHRY